jgi:tRNA pseudouridine55 synthase
MSVIEGMLLIDKPRTWTSFDVVNYVRRMVATLEAKKPKNCKVGHTGTLDPLASGLLIILVGKAYTRRAGELTKQDKTYEVTMRLGITSTTGDEEGEKTVASDAIPTESTIQNLLNRYTGELQQVPPVYSAMKVNGQRAYKLARAGTPVELAARPVTIYENQLVRYDYPFVWFTSQVSSGTYIRSLVEDLGKQLGTGAYMSDLRRTKIGRYDISRASEVASLSTETLEELLAMTRTEG